MWLRQSPENTRYFLFNLNAAVHDFCGGLRARRVWLALAHEEVGNQHRRTFLGPIWLLLNYLAFAGTFIFVFNRVDTSVPNHVAYVATGLFVWFIIMETISQGLTVFVQEESYIKGTRLPISVYVFKLSAQICIRSGYSLAGCLLILAISGSLAVTPLLEAAVGLGFVLLFIPPTITLFGFIGAFLPDSQYIVSNVMRIGMFLTPVFWYTADTGIRAVLYHYNPFTYIIDIVRHPVVFGGINISSYTISVFMFALLWMLALATMGALHKKLVFTL